MAAQNTHFFLVGGFNPSEMSQNGNLPQVRGENKKYLKPPSSFALSSNTYRDLSWQFFVSNNLRSPAKSRIPKFRSCLGS